MTVDKLAFEGNLKKFLWDRVSSIKDCGPDGDSDSA